MMAKNFLATVFMSLSLSHAAFAEAPPSESELVIGGTVGSTVNSSFEKVAGGLKMRVTSDSGIEYGVRMHFLPNPNGERSGLVNSYVVIVPDHKEVIKPMWGFHSEGQIFNLDKDISATYTAIGSKFGLAFGDDVFKGAMFVIPAEVFIRNLYNKDDNTVIFDYAVGAGMNLKINFFAADILYFTNETIMKTTLGIGGKKSIQTVNSRNELLLKLSKHFGVTFDMTSEGVVDEEAEALSKNGTTTFFLGAGVLIQF